MADDQPRPIRSAPSARATQAAADAAHAERVAHLAAELERQGWVKIRADTDEDRAAIRRAASAAASDLGYAVRSTITPDGAVMVAVDDTGQPPNPVRDQRDDARARRAIDDAFRRPED
ncbi:hypothetical protein CLV63_1641 [Murinocardiopsis flavida]|uniref:Uncharacterized protein n=1 Tax=Murinocardiopsis flavida TaxID=645275 RepID=A0A2P8C5C3_9ACTN|nr:hypothetical protein [Murinocardiopsis flavida]PSK80162.1 hypothetical protein CLV63_1641 [Murinocardiopsis flavida]